MRKIIVIMASYLTDYEGSAKNRSEKFLRAVESFLANYYEAKELIIVADGCDITESLYYKHYEHQKEIQLICINKQEKFSGLVRQQAIEHANTIYKESEIIAYLDSDDLLGCNHLQNIEKNFKENEFVYFNDYVYKRAGDIQFREVRLEPRMIGVSGIAHLNKPEYNWNNCDGYGHDWLFVQKLMNLTKNYKKIRGMQYYVAHIPKILDA